MHIRKDASLAARYLQHLWNDSVTFFSADHTATGSVSPVRCCSNRCDTSFRARPLIFASPPRTLLKGDRVAEAVVVVVKEERWMDKVTARPLSYRQPGRSRRLRRPRRAALTMTATRAIVAPLIDASLTSAPPVHTPLAHRNTRLSERDRKRRMVRTEEWRDRNERR